MSWIGNRVKVEGRAMVRGHACVSGTATVSGYAILDGYAHVGCASKVTDHVMVDGEAKVDDSILEGDVTISSGRIWDVHWWRDVP